MDLPAQERRPYVVLLLKNFPYACRIGPYKLFTLTFDLKFNTISKMMLSYPQARLLEINSHSLFSRWFSESGKLVQRLFGSVMDLIEEEDTFVVVLIGELQDASFSNVFWAQ